MTELKKILYYSIGPALVTAALISGIKYAGRGPSIELNKPQFNTYLTDTGLHVSAKNWNHYKEIYCHDDYADCSWDSVNFTDWSYGGSGGVQSNHRASPDFSKFSKLCDEIKEKSIVQTR